MVDQAESFRPYQERQYSDEQLQDYVRQLEVHLAESGETWEEYTSHVADAIYADCISSFFVGLGLPELEKEFQDHGLATAIRLNEIVAAAKQIGRWSGVAKLQATEELIRLQEYVQYYEFEFYSSPRGQSYLSFRVMVDGLSTALDTAKNKEE